MVTHYILRVGDGVHFVSSSTRCIWGATSTHREASWFLSNVRAGDILWFVKNKSRGQLIAVATFVRHAPRILGPLVSLTPTNEDLGWTLTEGHWDTEIHYTDLYNLTACGLHSEIKSPKVFRTYDVEKCKVDLPREYAAIARYGNLRRTM